MLIDAERLLMKFSSETRSHWKWSSDQKTRRLNHGGSLLSNRSSTIFQINRLASNCSTINSKNDRLAPLFFDESLFWIEKKENSINDDRQSASSRMALGRSHVNTAVFTTLFLTIASYESH